MSHKWAMYLIQVHDRKIKHNLIWFKQGPWPTKEKKDSVEHKKV